MSREVPVRFCEGLRLQCLGLLTFTNLFRACRAALLALAASVPTFAGEPHNFIVLIPESMPAAVVDPMTAPTLARLRAEGVYFNDSHTVFPVLGEVPILQSLWSPDSYERVTLTARGDGAHRPAGNRGLIPLQGVRIEQVVQEILPMLKETGRPFLLVYRMPAPPNSLPGHDSGANEGEEAEGVPAAMIALLEADDALASIESALKSAGLFDTTNIVVAAEHGFSTVWKDSKTSTSLEFAGRSRPRDKLPPGFLAIDLVDALQEQDAGLVLYDPDENNKLVAYTSGEYPTRGNAVIAVDVKDPYAVVKARGGYDLIYLPPKLSKAETRRRAQLILDELFLQDYVSGVFVDETRLGRVRGALSIGHLGWSDTRGDRPTIVVNFVSVSTGCDRPTVCTLMIADTPVAEGEQIHGALSRAETSNFIAARGPDFQERLVSRVPVSNADVVETIEQLIKPRKKSRKGARVLTEVLRGHEDDVLPRVRAEAIVSKPSKDGLTVTEARHLMVGEARYFDAAGAGGWTVGIPERPGPVEWRPWRWDWPRPSGFRIDITPD